VIGLQVQCDLCHLVTARSLWLLRVIGTICRHHLVEFILLTLSDPVSKHFSLPRHFSFFYFSAFMILTPLIFQLWLQNRRSLPPCGPCVLVKDLSMHFYLSYIQYSIIAHITIHCAWDIVTGRLCNVLYRLETCCIRLTTIC